MATFEHKIQQKLDAAMPWVGLYITVASAVCTIAMGADVFTALRRKRFWFPCKYFSLNAATLTLLAVAMKLSMDINTQMLSSVDSVVKHISLIFMITAMSNFMPSLASKKDREILSNVAALGILVITILVNYLIPSIELLKIFNRQSFNAVIANTVSVFLLLATIISSAITIPVRRRILESMHQQEAVMRTPGFIIQQQTINQMRGVLDAAEMGNPQFVVACSIFSVTAGVICLNSAARMVTIYIKWFQMEHHVTLGETDTAYGNYTKRILVIQTIGILVGMIPSISRWLVAVRFKRLEWRNEFKIEALWIQTLVDWRDSFSILKNQKLWCNKYIYDAKWFLLTLCIGFQVSIVLLSKFFLLISVLVSWPFFWLFGIEDQQPNLHPRANELIQRGNEQRLQELIGLLRNINSFDVLRGFDWREVEILPVLEPPNSWSLPLVTLTSIAIALPYVPSPRITQLVNCVNEGISLTRLVDKTLDTNARLRNHRRAADIGWGRLTLHRKWQGFDLRNASATYRNANQVLVELSQIAATTMKEFRNDPQDLLENLMNWPVNVIAANSMYRISQTILLSYQDQEDEPTDEELFDQLSTRIAGTLAACLTNLATVIINLCHCNAIGKREKSVRKAFLLLGKTDKILELLQQYEGLLMDHGRPTCIDEWYDLLAAADNAGDEDNAAVPITETK